MPKFTLTKDQENALLSFREFMLADTETVFVLAGYSGCGKTTLVKSILTEIDSVNKTMKLLNVDHEPLTVYLTATTNKAAENMERITGEEVKTIHSLLGLRVSTDYKTGNTTLVGKNGHMVYDALIFIDEASYVDKLLLAHIFTRTSNCKIVFVGDPAQLTPVKSIGAPVFDAKFRTAALTEVVRQAEGNPIIDLSTKFRHTVNTGEFFQFTPDGTHVQYLDRDAFKAKMIQEFTRKDWHFSDSKVLAWTNKCVIGYNNMINELVTGVTEFQVGDYAVSNSFVSSGSRSVKTDQLVEITYISPYIEMLDVGGHHYKLDGTYQEWFMPDSLAEKNHLIKKLKAQNRIHELSVIDSTWIDLRAAYACTINKAQGSTYGSVFIDLDDIRKCNSGNQIARMLYVAVSRAKSHVYLTGDLVA